jgi:hypothetical protein
MTKASFQARMRILTAASFSLAFALTSGSVAVAAHYSYSVPPGVQAIPLIGGSGEVQSTVVGAGLNANCPAGRLLISMDMVRPPAVGTVVGRDLNNPNTPDIKSTFDPDPDSANDQFLTNDDDIITMSNGDVLLLWGYHTIAPLNPKPPWFDVTFSVGASLSFGPGVRRGTIVYRSKDCGKSFHYVSRIDPAKIGDGSCAFPQPASALVPQPNPNKPNYSNGGSDGQLAKVDNNQVYLTMDCVGFKQDKTKQNFVLSSSPLSAVYVLRSDDEGTSWKTLGFIPGLPGDSGWRTGVVAMQNGNLWFGVGTELLFAQKKNNGTYTFFSLAHSPGPPGGWGPDYSNNPNIPIINSTRVMANTLATRVPGSKRILIAYPAAIKDINNKESFGYQMFLYDPQTNQFGQAEPILPAVHSPNNFLMHMAAIDPGSGPVLLYWYDINGLSKKATMRGRLIFADGNYSDDFVVAKDPSAPTGVDHKFDVNPAWYGDYLTAGGYATHGIQSALNRTYHYYPMWVQSDGQARYSHVIVDEKLSVKPLEKGGIIILYPKWKPAPPPVEVTEALRRTASGARVGAPFDGLEQQAGRPAPASTPHQ